MGQRLAQEEARAEQRGDDPGRIRMYLVRTADVRRYEDPVATDEMAIVFTGADGAPPAQQYIRVYKRNGRLQEISNMSSYRDPLMYPLLFPYGDPGM